MQQNRVVRLQVELSKQDKQAIDDFWFAKRFPSRAAAVRELLRRGLWRDKHCAQKSTANLANTRAPVAFFLRASRSDACLRAASGLMALIVVR